MVIPKYTVFSSIHVKHHGLTIQNKKMRFFLWRFTFHGKEMDAITIIVDTEA